MITLTINNCINELRKEAAELNAKAKKLDEYRKYIATKSYEFPVEVSGWFPYAEYRKDKQGKRGRNPRIFEWKKEYYTLDAICTKLGVSKMLIVSRYNLYKNDENGLWDEERIWSVQNHRNDHTDENVMKKCEVYALNDR